jgi:signal peptidase II
MTKTNRYWFGVILITIFALFLDRLIKDLFLHSPSFSTGFLFSDWLQFKLVLNQGIAFSWWLPTTLIVAVVIIILLALTFYWWRNYEKKNFFNLTVLSFIIIGAWSNLWDRLLYGGAVDWIDVSWFTVFNLADVYIVGAVIVWVIKELLVTKKIK